MTNKTSETRFFSQLKKYGFKRFVVSPDFILAFVVLVLMLADKVWKLEAFATADSSFIIGIVAAASTLFAITLASLAIILSFSTSDFVGFLRKHNKLGLLLFNFWIGNAAYILVIILSFFYLLFNQQFDWAKAWLYPFIAAVFLYALIDTFYILGAVVRFGYFVDFYQESSENKS